MTCVDTISFNLCRFQLDVGTCSIAVATFFSFFVQVLKTMNGQQDEMKIY